MSEKLTKIMKENNLTEEQVEKLISDSKKETGQEEDPKKPEDKEKPEEKKSLTVDEVVEKLLPKIQAKLSKPGEHSEGSPNVSDQELDGATYIEGLGYMV